MEKKTQTLKTCRCAIYTRKSHELDAEQDFNTLDAQREAGENYIASQKANGWVCLPERYDDGGFSGGNTNRPALQRLMKDIRAGRVDIVVVYKLDRLTRSLMDFSDLQEFFDRYGVSFVSVTQEINTSTSAGRMMLNILMTFAQYEREIIAERVRDKVAAAKKRGKHCGGYPVLGYDSDPVSKKLVINPREAEIVRFVFKKYLECGSAKEVAIELERMGCRGKVWTTKSGIRHDGQKINNHMIYRMLKSPLYIGRVPHRDTSYPGEHEAIVDEETWRRTQELLATNLTHDAGRKSTKLQPFAGLVRCGHCGGAITLCHTVKGKKRQYGYYLCNEDTKRNIKTCPTPRIPAAEFESLVLRELAAVLNTPTMLARIDRRLEADDEMSVRQEMTARAVAKLEQLWEVMVPTERYALIHNIVSRIVVFKDRLKVEFNRDGMVKLLQEAGLEAAHE